MSHFTVIKTQIRDQDALVKALADLGYPQVEVHDEPWHLIGYQGDTRAQTAEVIVRRRHVGKASNDLGFKRQDDGTFEAIVSAFDRARHGAAWLQKLTQRYAYHVVLAHMAEQGFALTQEAATRDGGLRLTLRRHH